MDDLKYGTRNKRGDWKPNDPLKPPPVFVFPPRPLALVKWLPHYFLPWNAIFMATALVFWTFLTPDVDTLKTLSPGWIAWLFVRNAVAVFLFFGALELRLYIRRAQGTQFKYNGKWPDANDDTFLFGNQNLDNIIRTFTIGVPIWTAYEVLILWVFANGFAPWLSFSDNILWLACLGLAVPIIHEFHFYCIHRLIHWPPLYHSVHRVHHNSVNPSPWSSLSMHPVELLLYFSGALIHLIVPSNPLLALYHLHAAGFGSVVGHIGFDRIVVGDDKAIDSHTYAHYLHHKYFEVNYADGLMPLDRIFGTWHDGTAEADERMNRRMKERAARLAARAGKQA